MSTNGAGEWALTGRLLNVYHRLHAACGPQHWWPGDGPLEIIAGAILTQSAAWTNVEKALANMKAAGVLSARGLIEIDEEELARLVRPSGYFRQKARKLKAFAALLRDRFGGDLQALLSTPSRQLRPLLLACHGIGPETADSIILYAAGQPAFVVDAYTRRVFARLGFGPAADTYDGWQRLFEDNLPAWAALFNEYHALIVRHGKERCRTAPRCPGCPLLQICRTGKQAPGAALAGAEKRIPAPTPREKLNLGDTPGPP